VLAQPAALPSAPAVGGAAPVPNAAQLLTALGGRANVLSVQALAGRVRVTLRDAGRIDATALRAVAVRGVAVAAPEVLHILVGLRAGEAAAAIEHLLK